MKSLKIIPNQQAQLIYNIYVYIDLIYIWHACIHKQIRMQQTPSNTQFHSAKALFHSSLISLLWTFLPISTVLLLHAFQGFHRFGILSNQASQLAIANQKNILSTWHVPAKSWAAPITQACTKCSNHTRSWSLRASEERGLSSAASVTASQHAMVDPLNAIKWQPGKKNKGLRSRWHLELLRLHGVFVNLKPWKRNYIAGAYEVLRAAQQVHLEALVTPVPN